jgi:chromosomal replication initiator protein
MLFKNTLRQQLAKFFPDHELTRWFDPIGVHMDEINGELHISFPHTYFSRWFMQYIRPKFETCTQSVIHNANIVYNKNPSRLLPRQIQDNARAVLKTGDAPTGGNTLSADALQRRGDEDTAFVGERQSFETFLSNKKNDLPVAAARQCVQNRAAACTPFVLYGPGGSGKSHLLKAMALDYSLRSVPFFLGSIELLEKIDITSENSFPIREQAIFLDDIQRLASFPRLQDTLIVLVDKLCETNRLLALACDAHPSRSPGLSPKLRSRLTSGLVMEVKRPDLDIRTRYVQRKNNELALYLDKDTMLTIAGRYTDIRNIDGFLSKLRFSRTLDANGLTPMDLLNRDGLQDTLCPKVVISRCASYFGISPEDIVGKSRDKRCTLARHTAIFLCKELLGLSLVQTGRVFGGRNHSSVLNSIRRIKQLCDSDNVAHKHVEEVKKLCLNQS